MTGGLLAAELVLDRPAHAYLLTGPDQDSLRDAAVLLTQAFSCTNLQPAGPCRACLSCREIASGVFADLRMGAPRLKLAEVKAELALLAERPLVGRRRVAVLAGVPDMTREAQNVLLKTLEEPPSASVLILTAPSAEGILPTVVSRCRHIPIPGPSEQALVEVLRQQGQDPDLASFAVLAAGNDRAVVSRLVARDDLAQLRADAVGFVVGALGEPPEPPLELVEKYQARIAQGEALPDWLTAVRGVLRAVLAAGAGDRTAMQDSLRPEDVRRVQGLRPWAAATMIEAIQSAETAVARHAAARLALEGAILTMYDQLEARR